MRRKRLGILLVAFLIHPAFLGGQVGPSNPPEGSQSETQCRKRILVFLDVSGSMYPLRRDSSSPFWQSLDALERLLNEPGFIEASDVVEVVRFGKRFARNRAQGREEILGLLQMLRENDLNEVDTDFRVFFGELSRALEESSFYNSQVILLGSDLVHEKYNGAPLEQDLEDWISVQAEKSEELKKIRDSSKNVATVFYVPVISRDRKTWQEDQRIQETVSRDFQEKAYLPRLQRITSSRASQSELVRGLIKGLTLPPKLTLSRDKSNRSQLAFIVTNPNCRDLRLKALSLRLGPRDGATSGPINFPISDAEANLGTTGSSEGTRTLTREIPTGGGWEDLSSLIGTVETEEGLIGETTGTAGSWLKFKPVRGVVEGNLPKPILRLDLSLLGHTEEARTYELTLRADGQSNDDPPLARRNFNSPEELDALAATVMRIVLPVRRDIYNQLENDATFRVAIAGAELSEEKKDFVQIVRDSVADRLNAYLLWAGLIGLVLVAGAWWRFFNAVQGLPALHKNRTAVLWWVGMLALTLLPLVLNGLHLWLLRLLPASWVDWLALVLSAIALLIALILSVRKTMSVSFGRKVLSADPPLEFEQYRRYSVFGAAVPWAIGFGLPAVFLIIWMVGRTGTSPDFAREIDLPQLDVVSKSR